MNLPDKYQWLNKEGAPKTIVEALKLYGILETAGPASNPIILEWAKELGLEKVYTTDSVAWCGLFMAIVAKRAGKVPVTDPLWALNWAKYGDKEVAQPMLGDTLVFRRDGGGHVTIYVAEDNDYYHCLGGNQSDQVNITRISKARLFHARRPIFKTGQPANVRKIIMLATGVVSINES